MLHAARWTYRTQKFAICAPSHKFVRLYLRNWGSTDNRKKIVKQQYLPNMSLQYGELRPTSGRELFESLRHPCKFQRVYRLVSVTAQHSSSGRQTNFAALNKWRHLYSAGRPSRSTLAHISSFIICTFPALLYTHRSLWCTSIALVTSTKEVMLSSLFVCLSATLRSKTS